ncbi:AsnC family transcriptional regulator [Actibacterium atlanticum]|uniref:AsnC family transcriptional regulator n=1 Tax=Actibacterium atlanticum TaxID=1461693 RepID=A0A058ZK64_9RHOB|nr:Lrp/AsnC family transcriptional regulator [Actibacterium atlanticum]KCV81577.1 AsnC family transcriptional regulator [Actibacterium atlanticum]
MDDLDKQILSHLARDARVSLSVLARKLSVARTTLQARIERLERSGVIAGYTLRLGEAGRQNRIRATILLSVEPRAQPAILARLKTIPEVETAHTTSGRFDLLLQVAATGTAALDKVLDGIGLIEGVKSSESLIHLTTRIDRGV